MRSTPGCACAPSPRASRGIQPATGRASRSSSPRGGNRRARLAARASRVRRSPRASSSSSSSEDARMRSRMCARCATSSPRGLPRAARASAARAEEVPSGVDLRVPLLPRRRTIDSSARAGVRATPPRSPSAHRDAAACYRGTAAPPPLPPLPTTRTQATSRPHRL